MNISVCCAIACAITMISEIYNYILSKHWNLVVCGNVCVLKCVLRIANHKHLEEQVSHSRLSQPRPFYNNFLQ